MKINIMLVSIIIDALVFHGLIMQSTYRSELSSLKLIHCWVLWICCKMCILLAFESDKSSGSTDGSKVFQGRR